MTEPATPVDPRIVDLDALAAWMDQHRLGSGPISAATPLAGGTQNLLLQFRRAKRTYVLRRPPEHKRATSDETMRREARVLAALAGSDVPHPALIAAEPDPDVLGAAFYLMDPINGYNPAGGLNERHRESARSRHDLGLSFVDGIATLHGVDHESADLAGFGRPDGYLERQVPRWRGQLESYAEMSPTWSPDIAGIDETGRWLDANRPDPVPPTIIHGDYHLGNVMFAPDRDELAAIVDWELATVGDPLVDLGTVIAFWPGEARTALHASIQPWDGFPSAADLVTHYRERSGRDVSAHQWYAVLACYKTGIILEGTYARSLAGRAPKAIGEQLHAICHQLFARAHALISAA